MIIELEDKFLYQLCNCSSHEEFIMRIREILSNYLFLVHVSENLIYKIKFITQTECAWGKVNTIKTVPLQLEIEYSYVLLWYLFRDQKDKFNFSKSVIMHEIYHCKEMSITYSILEYDKINFDPQTYYDLCLNLGSHQWSEYYAYYHSSVIEIPTFKSVSNFSSDFVDQFKNFCQMDFRPEGEYAIIYNTTIHPFIHNAIKLISSYHCTQNKLIKSEINTFKNFSHDIKLYFEKLDDLFLNYYTHYPDKVSYDSLRQLGKALLTLE